MHSSSSNLKKSNFKASSSTISEKSYDDNNNYVNNKNNNNVYSSNTSITSSTGTSSRFFGNVTLEMIDDFLNPVGKKKDSKHSYQLKFLPAPTTQCMGNFDQQNEDYYDQSVNLSMSNLNVNDSKSKPANYSNFFQKSKKEVEINDFEYVQKYRKSFEQKLIKLAEKKSELRGANHDDGKSVIGAPSVIDAHTVVGSAMSQIESVSTFPGTLAFKNDFKRRAELITKINDNEDDMIEFDDYAMRDIINDKPVDVDLSEEERRTQLFNDLVTNYKFLDDYNPKLPITKHRQNILDSIDSYKFSIIHGGTGCGKTTQVPQYILDQHVKENRYCNIIVTQPRRIAATSIARRVCSERGWNLGGVCGYQIGLDRTKLSEDTRICYVTTGVLLQKLISPDFESNFNQKYTHILLDEIHERDLDTDFVLLVLKIKNFQNLKPKVVLMSATIDTNIFAEYFTSQLTSLTLNRSLIKPPVQEITHKTYKVQKFYWEDLVDTNGFLNKTMINCYTKKVEKIKYSRSYNEETLYTRGMSYWRSTTKRATDKYMSYEADSNGIYTYQTFTNRLQNLEFKREESDMYEETMIMVINLLKFFDEQEILEIRKRPGYVEIDEKTLAQENNDDDDEKSDINIKPKGPRIIGRFPEIRNSVLIFVPGMLYIQRLQELISKELYDDRLTILPLHSDIVSDQQQRVFERVKPTHRKVIIATSIAESSITVPDVKYVIDFGLTKEMYCDPYTNYTHLRLEWASKSSMEQRCGRAGRVSEGMCFRLVPKDFYESLINYSTPAILREPLSQVILNVKRLGQTAPPIYVLSMALTAPKLSDVERTILLLKEVGALSLYTRNSSGERKNNPHDGDLTFVGRIMASLPIDVKLAKLILLGHTFGKLNEAIILAAAFSNKTFFTCYFKSHIESFNSKWLWSQGWMCDSILILNAYKVYEQYKERGVFARYADRIEWARKNMIELKRLEEVEKLKSELESRLRALGIECNRNIKLQELVEEGKYSIDDAEDVARNNLIIKMMIAGAFYPNYFSAPKIDIQEALKNVSGRSLHDTVQIKNLPMNEGILYNQKLTELFRQCSKRIQIHYEDSKAYIEFKSKMDEVPSSVNYGVYLAVQFRMLRLPMKFPRFNSTVTQEKLLKIQQLRNKNRNFLVTLDPVGAIKFNKMKDKKKHQPQTSVLISEDSNESDTDTINGDEENEETTTVRSSMVDTDDDEMRHRDFISAPKETKKPASKYLSLLSLESISNNSNSVASVGASNNSLSIIKAQSLRHLNTNRLTTCENTFAEYLSNPRYLLPPEVDQGKHIAIAITEVVECGHFWVQIDDKSHKDVLSFIHETLNYSSNTVKPLNTNELKENTLCVAYYKEVLYRARILYVSKEEMLVVIQYVDFGNKEKKKLGEVFQLSEELHEYPFQALECTLDNIKPSLIKNPNGIWTANATKLFQSITEEINSKFEIKVNYLIDERAIVDLQVLRDQSKTDMGELLRESGYAEECDEGVKNFYASRSSFCSQEIMYVPYRESDYVSKKPQYVNSGDLKGTMVKNNNRSANLNYNREQEEDSVSSVADSLSTDRATSSFVDNDINSYSGEISIRGPYSPLEVNYYALANVGHSRKVRIERDSINYANIDDDPLNEANRLMIASDISLNASGNGMILRKTCLMPKFPGLLGICCLLFAPTAELRLDDEEMFYTGAICGLGYDSERKMPIHPDNDIECVFDTRLNMKDLGMINSVRMAINMVIGDEQETKTWSTEPKNLRRLQQAACIKILELIQRNREIVEPYHFSKPGKWNQVDPRKLIIAHPQSACLEEFEKENDKIYYTYHKAVALDDIVTR